MSQEQPNPVCGEDGCSEPAKVRGMCRRHYHKVWRAENREEYEASQREYAKRTKAERKEYARQYYLANREKILARERRKREEGGEEYRRYAAKKAREWQQANPERYRVSHRRYFVKKKYGLELEDYEAILARGCAICGTKTGDVVTRSGDGMPLNEPRLCIDHDHVNGKVRDALCHSCNTGLGSFRDDPARLRAAAMYLERHAL